MARRNSPLPSGIDSLRSGFQLMPTRLTCMKLSNKGERIGKWHDELIDGRKVFRELLIKSLVQVAPIHEVACPMTNFSCTYVLFPIFADLMAQS